MRSKTFIAISMVAVFLSVAMICAIDGGESDATQDGSIRVWIEDKYGDMKLANVYGSTVRAVIESAAEELSMDIEYDDLGKIIRVDGVKAETGEYWNIHQWMPLGYYDWTSVGYDERSDSWLVPGTSYCLHRSGMTIEEGTTVYEKPLDLRPKSEGYVFIRFTKEYDSSSEHIRDVFTSDMRREGFWIKGYGSNWGEVLKDAMETNGFECEFVTKVDGHGNDLQYWFSSFFGLKDKNLGDDDSWAYWSQWIFTDGKWSYNDYTMGYYDPAVYKYVACVYIQSYGGTLDIGGNMPDPEIQPPTALSIRQNVEFRANGKLVGEAKVRYGKSLTADQIPDYQPDEGYEFLGWGDTTVPIVKDTVFEANLKLTTPKVTFITEGRIFHTVDVQQGGKVSLDVSPVKQESYACRYEFVGWSKDITVDDPVIENLETMTVTGSMTLYAYFNEIKLETTKVTFVLGTESKTFDAVVGKTIPENEIPSPPEGYLIVGWSDDINQKITSEKTFTATLREIVLTITYLDSNGDVWKSEKVSYGKDTVVSDVPIKDGTEDNTYEFLHWAVKGTTGVADLTKIKADMTLVPIYKEIPIIKCKVKFILDGKVCSEVTVVKGERLSKSQIPVVDIPDDKIFSGWVGTDEIINEDRVFEATLTDKVYNSVRFVTYDGSIIHSEDVEDGKFSTYTGKPERPDSEYASYTFVGWTKDPSAENPVICDPSSTPITGDTVFTAVFRENPFPTSKVSFVSEGITISEIKVVTGRTIDKAKVPVPTKEGYSFKGWDKNIDSEITEDTVFTAEFEILRFTVTYRDDRGTILHEETVEYGQGAKYSKIPSKQDSEYARYTFKWWASSLSDSFAADLSLIKGDRSVIAVFEEKPFPTSKVTFKVNDEVISVVDVVNGRTLSESQIPDPRKEGFDFSGWGAGIYAPIDHDVTFTATLTIKELKVMFYSEDGVLLYTESVKYGSPSTYGIQPSKDKTQEYTYVFKGWSQDPDAETVAIADLSSIRTDMKLRPVFDSILNKYAVTFCDYDRSVIKTIYVEYGKAVEDYPDKPSREQSVDKVFSFRGWSISPLGWSESDLSCITESKTAYAYYDYTIRQYVLEIYDGDILLGSMDVGYGSFLSEKVFMTTVDGHLLKLYRDQECTKPVNTSYSFSGYTKLYAQKIPGQYGYLTEGSVENHNKIRISFDDSSVSELTRGDVTVVADISQFAAGKTIVMDSTTIRNLCESLGADAVVRFILTKGYYEMTLGSLDAVMADRGFSQLSISMDKGPTSLVKVNAALKKINYDSLLSFNIELDGIPADMAVLKVIACVPYERDANDMNAPRVWTANPGTGVLTQIECGYSNGYLRFTLGDSTLHVIGTAFQRSDTEDSSDPSPYGDLTTELHPDVSNAVTITGMKYEGNGYLLFIPSYYRGSIVAGIGSGAFSAVTNVTTIIIPSTVVTFDWNSLATGSIASVYFLDSAPEFIGDVPAGISVYVLQGAEGWNDIQHEVLHKESYKYNDGTLLYYYLIDGEIIICGYSGGSDVKIPSYISVNGTEYPVTIIGLDAFMNTSVKNVKISETVREIQSGAFQSSKLTTVVWANNSSLLSICDGAFRDCKSLRTSSVPEGVRFIGNDAFMNCNMIASMKLPDSLRFLGDHAFYNCNRLASIDLGNGITDIGSGTFAYCTVLDNVYLPGQIKTIGAEAFMNCSRLTSIDTSGVIDIGENAFRSCGSLNDVVLNKSLERIGEGAFSNALLLTSMTAYCTQPEGFSEAFSSSIPDNLELIVNYDVSSSWAMPHTVLEKEDDMMESFEGRTMPYVIGAMIVLFIVLGIYCFRHRMM